MINTPITGSALWGALSAIAGFLTDKVGVPVVRGSRPSTDLRSIFLPKLPDTSMTWSEVIKVIAFLYHEAAHILWTTHDGEALTPLERSIRGKLEDIRIELKAIGTFPAASKYLGDLVRMLTEEGMSESPKGIYFSPLSQEQTEVEVLQWYLLYRLRHDVLKQTGIAPVLASAEAAVAAKLPSGMRTRLDGLMFQITDCESTADVVSLTREIVKMIAEEKEKAEEKAKQDNDAKPPQADQQQQAAGNGDASGDGDGDSDGEQQASGQPGADEGTDDSQSASSQDPSDSGSDGGDPSGDSATDGASAGSGEDAAANAEALSRLLEMSDEDVVGDLGDMLKQAVDAVSESSNGGGTSLPNIHKLPLKQQPVDMNGIRGSINAVRTKTLNWMSSAAQSEVTHERRGMMIDPTQLYRYRLGGDIFVEETEGVDLNAAIAIVIDRSGSMSMCIVEAAKAAVATMLAFDVPGIKTQVSVFPVYDAAGDEGVAIVKRWDETSRSLASRMGSLGVQGGTPMAEAILSASATLLPRTESLKLVMVVTDGDPSDLEATHDVITKARAAGIAVTGVGIGVDPSEVFGERHAATLASIDELSSVMVRLVKSAIVHH
ncbi:MAG: VWA domain-containing protein [Sulfuritalea sp.]|nr:VWA domain-containing protein [Sulfuritalea sp.]